jgi:hypothetical protein
LYRIRRRETATRLAVLRFRESHGGPGYAADRGLDRLPGEWPGTASAHGRPRAARYSRMPTPLYSSPTAMPYSAMAKAIMMPNARRTSTSETPRKP